MTKKQNKVTKAGAVALDESQLDDAHGGVIAIAPSTADPAAKRMWTKIDAVNVDVQNKY